MMGGLTARPGSEQALLIASGRRMYALHEDSLEHIATFPGKIEGLALRAGAVAVGGNFHGVREALTGTILGGRFSGWKRVASAEGIVYGVPDAEGRKDEIWDVEAQVRVAKRTGDVTALASDTLSDACLQKEKISRRRGGLGTVRISLTSQEHLLGEIASGYAAHALSWHGAGMLLYGQRSFVSSVSSGETKTAYASRVDSETFRARDALQRIVGAGRNGPMRALWAQVRDLCGERGDWFPKNPSSFRFPHELRAWGWKGVPLRIPFGLLPYEETMRTLSSQSGGRGASDDTLREVLESMRESLLDHEYRAHRVSAIASVGEDVVIGTQSGRLERTAGRMLTAEYSTLPPHDELLIREFSLPVTALLPIPIDVYDEGIRQRAAANRSRRRYFAQRVANSVPLRYIA